MRRSRAWLAGLALPPMAAFAVAFGSGCGCDDIGCSEGVGVDLPRAEGWPRGAFTVRACVDGRCETTRYGDDALARQLKARNTWVEMPIPDADEARVSYVVRDADGVQLHRVSGVTPISENRVSPCASCRVIVARITSDGELVPRE